MGRHGHRGLEGGHLGVSRSTAGPEAEGHDRTSAGHRCAGKGSEDDEAEGIEREGAPETRYGEETHGGEAEDVGNLIEIVTSRPGPGARQAPSPPKIRARRYGAVSSSWS